MNRPRAFSFFTKKDTATVTGEVFDGAWSNVGKAMVQAVVNGTGAVTATIPVYGSNNGIDWQLIGTIALSDTTSDSDVQAIDYPWMFIRVDLTAISGTGAEATAVMAI
jgi:hypothetical protein